MEKSQDTKLLPPFLCDHSQLENNVEETDNGLCLNNVYIPEEIILHILAFVDPNELLKCSLVCRNWNKFIKSYTFWSTLYGRKYRDSKPKQLPWYLFYCLLSTNYFNNNLLKNGNGQEGFNHWNILFDGGNGFTIEDLPAGADPLPLDLPEFQNQTSCFATSYGTCRKSQKVQLGKSKLFRYILNSYKPHIYLSEWTAGRFDCGCIYKLRCELVRSDKSEKYLSKPCAFHQVNQWEGSTWEKIEITITEYPDDIEELIFEHDGRDTQYWAGHYGSKMAGGVLKLLFDSIEPLPTDESGREIAKMFSDVKYETNGEKDIEELHDGGCCHCGGMRRRRRIRRIVHIDNGDV
ncbi:hypothetical protein ILUMI_05241 [Ignelater luminosus]|uniref:F-box only protein 6 n=1 Tax=Ignelater luminosus TaxID=2038154 RepID=A0A8K0DCB5_IGNLU|nr:hypothetical protein ILUMI_05241 [Ignelater luminosus]